jgi:hypothetical protein
MKTARIPKISASASFGLASSWPMVCATTAISAATTTTPTSPNMPERLNGPTRLA